jgi:hypothetical protein
MGLLNKTENWWLRLSLVLFALIALGSASVMNRSVTQERQTLTDSVSYFKLQNDSIQIKYDSLINEHFILNVELGRDELTWEYLKENYPNVYNNVMKYKSHETE